MLLFTFLLVVLPTLTFGLKCHQGLCVNGECNTREALDACPELSPLDRESSRTVVCLKVTGDVKANGKTIHYAAKGCEKTGGGLDLEIGCKNVMMPAVPVGGNVPIPFAGDIKVCGCSTDYCNGETKIHALVGLIFATFSLTLIYKYSI